MKGELVELLGRGFDNLEVLVAEDWRRRRRDSVEVPLALVSRTRTPSPSSSRSGSSANVFICTKSIIKRSASEGQLISRHAATSGESYPLS